MTGNLTIEAQDVLVVVDVQNDFCPEGRLAVAFDFCVRYSLEDAKREGFEVVVVEDACRGIDVDGSVLATRRVFDAIGVRCVSAEAVG